MVRLRFAPSPTGIPHVGNLHTALFSWALSRALGGDFILRIEDTDPNRNTPQAASAMIEALTWLGIDWDEGPDIGGDYAPYVQSQRRPFHQKAIDQLLAGNHAYYGDDPNSPAAPAGNPLRLRMPRTGQTILHDAIRGDIAFENSSLQDIILVRSDGRPLYHLAAMTDDHDMAISHVVRGEEWIASAPYHIQLYRALGWAEPVWIHVPLILNRHGQKLKKRDPEGGYLITDFQAAGYLPSALFNYLLLLGWSPVGTQEILDRWQVRQQFGIQRLSPSPSVFDWDKLNWVNQQYIQKLSKTQLADLIAPYLEDAYGALPNLPDWLETLTAVIRPQLAKLDDAVVAAEWALDDSFETSAAAHAALQTDAAHPVLTQLVAEVASIVLLDQQTASAILQGLRQRGKETHGWGATAVFHPIRAALTGQVGGPPLPDIMSILGKQRTLQRLAAALK